MEEYDDLVPTPNEDGSLELTYRGWTLVDEVIWTMGRELVTLDISYNSITEFPPEFGDLGLLKELNCSCNELKGFPKQIGKLRSLKYLKCNGNHIIKLPPEIGQCARLTKLLCGENKLETVPVELSNLHELEELQLCNNRLNYIPPAIALSPRIKIIDIVNNPDLAWMVPLKLQGRTEFVSWMCEKHFKHDNEVTVVKECNNDYDMMIERARNGTQALIEKVEVVNNNRVELKENMPQGCDRRCMVCYNCVCVTTGLRRLGNCTVM